MNSSHENDCSIQITVNIDILQFLPLRRMLKTVVNCQMEHNIDVSESIFDLINVTHITDI